MIDNPYRHQITKKIIIAFGKLFSNIKIQRFNTSDEIEQLIDVPISYGNKEKWYQRLREEKDIDTRVAVTLPRIGFEISGMQYDSSRRLNQLTQYRNCGPDDNGNFLSAFAPVPYKLGFSLYVMTKTQDDMFQIIEQIIPFFGPKYTLAVNALPELSIIQDVPIVLDSITTTDSYEGVMEDRREIVSTLSFTAHVEYFGPVRQDNNIILHTRVKIDPQSGDTARQVDTDVVGTIDNYTVIESYFDIPRPIS